MATDQAEMVDLSLIFLLVERELGFRLEDYRQSGIVRRLTNRMKLAGCQSYPEYLALLEKDPTEATRLLEYVTIKWSRFFRDQKVFDQLKNRVLPDLLARKGDPLSIWSAGCANGEETYSLAILVQQLAPVSSQALILGTDIDQTALTAAHEGLYPHWSLDGVPVPLVRECFSPVPIRSRTLYRLRGEVRSSARFLRHDLLSASSPPEGRSFDIVLCRNVLIYFDRRVHARVFDLLAASLNAGGYLCLGEAEQMLASHNPFFDTVDRQSRLYQRR